MQLYSDWLQHGIFMVLWFRDGLLEKWRGGGWGISSLHEFFFFRSLLVPEFFFQVNPSARVFFFRQISLFLNSKTLIHYLCFVLFKLFYTHNRSKDTGHFNAKSFRKRTHSERGGSHLEWTASLCIFSVPALWNSSPLKFGQNRCPRVQKKPPRLTCVSQKRLGLSLLIWAIQKNTNTRFGYNNMMQVFFFFNRCAIWLIIWHTTYSFPLLLFTGVSRIPYHLQDC